MLTALGFNLQVQHLLDQIDQNDVSLDLAAHSFLTDEIDRIREALTYYHAHHPEPHAEHSESTKCNANKEADETVHPSADTPRT